MNRLWIILFILAFAAGCQSYGPKFDARRPAPTENQPVIGEFSGVERVKQFDPAWLEPPRHPFTLGPGDRLEIEVIGELFGRGTVVVGPDGKIYFHLLNGLDVWGKTLPQVRDEIRQGLRQYLRDEQQVSVTLLGVESQRVWLLGRLVAPGVYPLGAPMTLMEAIAQAGGLAPAPTLVALGGSQLAATTAGMPRETADLRRSFVMRDGKMLPVDFQRLLRAGDLSQNIYLQAGDFVYLPSAQSSTVYVLGAVLQPRAVRLTGPATLAAAITSAGGTIRDAHLTQVAVIRGSLQQPQVAIVNFEAIRHGRQPDVRIEPGDIIHVPVVPYEIFSRYLDLVLDTFVRTYSANEGARAIDRNAGRVGIVVPINSAR